MTQIEFIISIVAGLGAIIVALGYFIGSFRRGQDEASLESNKILRGLIDDQKEEISKLRGRLHDMTNEMTAVKLQLQVLTDRRDYLETLIMTALSKEFTNDPNLATTVKTLVEQSKLTKKSKT